MFSKGINDIENEYIKRFNPKLICFTTVSTEYQFIADIAKYIKNRYKDIYLLIGGPHVSLNPDDILSDGFDALCIGEGKHFTLELVSQLENIVIPHNTPICGLKMVLLSKRIRSVHFYTTWIVYPFPIEKCGKNG